jgi:hypothetical protein
MTDVSKSPHQNEVSHSEERNTFQRDAYISRCKKDGKEPDPDQLAMYEEWAEKVVEQEADPKWREDNLEYDLRSTEWILEKARGDKVYAQHIYAALCNTDWQRTEPWPILKNQTWSCSWRHAGGIIADMVGEGDYIDWYCSGIVQQREDYDEWAKTATEEQLERYKKGQAHVGEGIVTDEIREDFLKLGWQLVWEYVPN